MIADIMAANNNETPNGRFKIKANPKAIINMEANNPKVARNEIVLN